MGDKQKAAAGTSAAFSAAGTTATLATSIFTAAAAANAVPVWGQVASAGLAIAGLLSKIFIGRRDKKRAAAKKKEDTRQGKIKSAHKAGVGPAGSTGMGLAEGQGPIGATAPVQPPQTPSFSSYGGGAAPTIQPTQQALNSSIGLK